MVIRPLLLLIVQGASTLLEIGGAAAIIVGIGLLWGSAAVCVAVGVAMLLVALVLEIGN